MPLREEKGTKSGTEEGRRGKRLIITFITTGPSNTSRRVSEGWRATQVTSFIRSAIFAAVVVYFPKHVPCNDTEEIGHFIFM